MSESPSFVFPHATTARGASQADKPPARRIGFTGKGEFSHEAAAVLSLCLAGYLAAWPALGYTADRPLPIYCVDRPEKVCAISFDAAWGADNTQGILDVLAKYNVKATFFVVGNWADQYPQQAKAIVESGCELMNHSNAHGHFNASVSYTHLTLPTNLVV